MGTNIVLGVTGSSPPDQFALNNNFAFIGTSTTVEDNDVSSLVFGVQSATTPEPTSIITLIGVGVLGVASKKFKKKA